MSAHVTNFTQAHAADTTTWTLAAVAGADAAFPSDGGSIVGIDGTTNCQQLHNTTTDLTINWWYSAWASFGTSYDLSAVDQAFCLHLKNNSPGYNAIGALRVALFSGGGTTDYGIWDFAATASIKNGSFWPLQMTGTPASTGGTFDDTDITGIAFLAQSNANGSQFAFQISVDQCVYINGPVVLEDTGAAATVTMEDYYDLLKPTSGQTYHSLLVARAGPTFEFGFPISIQADDYDDSSAALGIAFKESDGQGFGVMAAGYYQLEIIGQASGSIIIENAALATNSTDYDLTIDGSAAGTDITMTSCLMAGVRNADISGAGLTMVGCTLSAPDTCSIADGDLDLTINSPAAPVDWDADLVTGSTITITSPVGDALDINFDVGNYSDINIVVPTCTINVAPTTGDDTYILTGISSAGTVTFDNTAATTVNTTISRSADLAAQAADPTSGSGTVTVTGPIATIDVGNTALVNGSKYLIRNETQDTELAIGTVSGGSGITINITEGTDYDQGDEIKIYATYQSGTAAKKNHSESQLAGTTDISFIGAQQDWAEYGDIAIDGSAVSECSTDFVNVQVDIVDADNSTTKSRIMAFLVYAQTLDDGIRNWFGALNLVNASNGIWDQTVADINISNEKSGSTLQIKDPASLRKADGSSMISGSTYSIEWEVSGLVSQIETGVSGLTAGESTQLNNIHTKTSSLTFTPQGAVFGAIYKNPA